MPSVYHAVDVLVSGLTALTRPRNPERMPSMAGLVVHALTLFNVSLLLSKYSETSVKISSSLVVDSRQKQNKNSS